MNIGVLTEPATEVQIGDCRWRLTQGRHVSDVMVGKLLATITARDEEIANLRQLVDTGVCSWDEDDTLKARVAKLEAIAHSFRKAVTTNPDFMAFDKDAIVLREIDEALL